MLCTELKNLQDQRLMPEHNLVLGMSCQAPFSLSALKQQQSGKVTNQERKEAMKCVLMSLGFCMKANTGEFPGLGR